MEVAPASIKHCALCKGTGEVDVHGTPCFACNGTGHVHAYIMVESTSVAASSACLNTCAKCMLTIGLGQTTVWIDGKKYHAGCIPSVTVGG